MSMYMMYGVALISCDNDSLRVVGVRFIGVKRLVMGIPFRGDISND